MSKDKYAMLASAFLILFSVGCGGSDGDNDGGTGRGTLNVRLADAPDPTISELNVVIDDVQANVNDRWVDIETDPIELDLLELARTDTEIGSAQLPVGTYNQIRLFVREATVTDADGTHTVTIPSADQTGIKVNIPGGYRITDRQITTLLLDFDVDKSLVKAGNGQYILRPTIRGVVKVLSGTITGSVRNDAGAVDNALITVYHESDLVNPVATTSTFDDGTFKVWALLPGEYRLVVEWDDDDADLDPDEGATLEDVVVVRNQNTDVGVIDIDVLP